MLPLWLGQVRVVDEEGGQVTPDSGEVGEVQVRGPTLFSGYWQLPQATAGEAQGNGSIACATPIIE